MIRIFNHYVHGSALRGIAFDQAVLLLIAGVAVVLNVGSLQQALPMAGKETFLLAALLFVVSTSMFDTLRPNCVVSLRWKWPSVIDGGTL